MAFLDTTGLTHLVSLIKENFLGIGDKAASAATADAATTAATASKLGSSTVGGVARPIYLNSGAATACSATAGDEYKPVYMSGGTITASGSTVGDSSTPVYLNAGTLTACEKQSDIEASTSSRYLILGGIIIQWGETTAAGGTVTLPIAYTSVDSYVVVNGDTSTSTHKYSNFVKRQSNSTFYAKVDGSRIMQWLTIGY